MADKENNKGRIFDEGAVLKNIVQGTAIHTGEDFFRSLVEINGNKPGNAEHSSIKSREKLLTEQDFKKLEHDNLVNALESTKWRIYGKDGAAELLGMNPSTLRSRIKALAIKRHQ